MGVDMAQSQSFVQLTHDLKVAAAVDGKLVTYTIYPNRTSTEPVKTTRYSELLNFQKALKLERPEFPDRLPPKTLRHQTSSDFVESRREAIETYLQCCVLSKYVVNSRSWRRFFFDSATPIGNGDATSNTASMPETKQESEDETKQESEDEDIDLDGTVYNQLRTHLQKKKVTLISVKDQQSELSQRLATRELELQIADEERDLELAHRQEAVTRLSTHRSALEELEHEMMLHRRAKADLEASKTAEIKGLEDGLSAAKEATRAARAKFEATRISRSQIEAEGRSKIIDCDTKVLNALVEHVAATEHLSSMRAAISTVADRLQARGAEARRIKIESDVALNARDGCRQETDVMKEDARRSNNIAMNTAAALASHQEHSARRERAFEAAVRRAKTNVQHATSLRDLRSRGDILEEDRADFVENVVLSAKRAERILSVTLKRSEESLNADKEKHLELRKADSNANTRLKEHDTIVTHMEPRLLEVESKYKEASEKFAIANAARKIAKQDFGSLESRVKGELQTAANEADRKLQELREAGEEARAQVNNELAPLLHQEEAERKVLKHAEEAEANLMRVLDEARVVVAEAKGDQYEVQPDALGMVQQASLLLESAKTRVYDHRHEVDTATEGAKQASEAVRAAVAELKEQESLLASQRAEIRREVDAVLAAEGASQSSSFAAEVNDVVESEEDFPEIQQSIQKVTVLKAALIDLQSFLDEKNASLQAFTAAAETAEAELAQLEEEENNVELPPLTVYQLSQELHTVAEYMTRHEHVQEEIMQTSIKRREDWAEEKRRLQDELHLAGVSLEVARNDMDATKEIAKSMRG